MYQLLDQRRQVAMQAMGLEMDLKDPRLPQSHEAREERLAEIARLHAQLRTIKRDLLRLGLE